MDPTKTEPERQRVGGLAAWLRSTVTITVPGWGITAGAAALLALVLAALD